MPVLRLCGGSVSMRRAPKRTSPLSSSAKPATIRKSVVLPQPEGPSKVKNSPSAMVIEMSSTARTAPKDRLTRSIPMLAKGQRRERARSARRLDGFLELLERLGALRVPALLVVFEELQARERRHGARQRREVEVLARRPAEGRLQDHLTDVLARDVVDELLRRVRVRPALDDRDALHQCEGAVGRVDGLDRRAVARPKRTGIFERHPERVLAIADPLEHERRAVQHPRVGEQRLELRPAGVAAAPLLDEHGRVRIGGAGIRRVGEGDLALVFWVEEVAPALRAAGLRNAFVFWRMTRRCTLVPVHSPSGSRNWAGTASASFVL